MDVYGHVSLVIVVALILAALAVNPITRGKNGCLPRRSVYAPSPGSGPSIVVKLTIHVSSITWVR